MSKRIIIEVVGHLAKVTVEDMEIVEVTEDKLQQLDNQHHEQMRANNVFMSAENERLQQRIDELEKHLAHATNTRDLTVKPAPATDDPIPPAWIKTPHYPDVEEQKRALQKVSAQYGIDPDHNGNLNPGQTYLLAKEQFDKLNRRSLITYLGGWFERTNFYVNGQLSDHYYVHIPEGMPPDTEGLTSYVNRKLDEEKPIA